jgi:hypothetical protein
VTILGLSDVNCVAIEPVPRQTRIRRGGDRDLG